MTIIGSVLLFFGLFWCTLGLGIFKDPYDKRVLPTAMLGGAIFTAGCLIVGKS